MLWNWSGVRRNVPIWSIWWVNMGEYGLISDMDWYGLIWHLSYFADFFEVCGNWWQPVENLGCHFQDHGKSTWVEWKNIGVMASIFSFSRNTILEVFQWLHWWHGRRFLGSMNKPTWNAGGLCKCAPNCPPSGLRVWIPPWGKQNQPWKRTYRTYQNPWLVFVH